MIKYNENTVVSFSFNQKDTKNPVYVRGKLVKLTSLTNSLVERFKDTLAKNNNVLQKHFLDATTLAVLISNNFKFEGIFKLQITSQNGLLKAILIDCKNNGNVRGFISINESFNKDIDLNKASFKTLVGDGFMIFHLDSLNYKEPYQAVVGLGENNLEETANNWFEQSEQIKTYIKLFKNEETLEAGALFLQVVAQEQRKAKDVEQVLEDFNTLSILTNTMTNEEFFATQNDDLLYKLYNEFDTIIYPSQPYYYKCSCSKEKVVEMLSAFAQKEEGDDDSPKEIECSFCGTKYYI
jgi:molecular chaperone Hsp33